MHLTTTHNLSKTIARQNDIFRSCIEKIPWSFFIKGKTRHSVPTHRTYQGCITITSGIEQFGIEDQVTIFDLIKNFTDFRPVEDPEGQRDFGTFVYQGKTVIFTIDYTSRVSLYNDNPDYTGPDGTYRTLTIMLSHEYLPHPIN